MEKNNSNRDGILLRSSATHIYQNDNKLVATASSNDSSVLQWGNRKRLTRCTKVQKSDRNNNSKSNSPGSETPVQRSERASVRVDRRVVRSDQNIKESTNELNHNSTSGGSSGHNGYSKLHQRPATPSHRILRNSENSIAMRGQSNGDRRGNTNNKNNHNHNSHTNKGNTNDNDLDGRSPSSETTNIDGKKGGSPPPSDAIPVVWPPKFAIALTNKEKEEDFLVLKGSKLPQRPKKRAKFIQRTVNLISPGAWLCDLSLERYEVREKKVSKKRPRGLKAMGHIESDSE